MWAGEVNLADHEQRVVCGMVHWERVLQKMRGPRFDEALGIVAERNAREKEVRLLFPGTT